MPHLDSIRGNEVINSARCRRLNHVHGMLEGEKCYKQTKKKGKEEKIE